jgi:hypothetical protein
MSQVAKTLYALRDVHLPDAVSAWPSTPGWTVLFVLLIVACLVGIGWGYRYWRRRRLIQGIWQRFTELECAYHQQTQPAERVIAELSTLLRRLALRAYPREQIAGLQGNDWLAFLDKSLGGDDFQQRARELVTAPYQARVTSELQPVFDLCRQWIKHHV